MSFPYQLHHSPSQMSLQEVKKAGSAAHKHAVRRQLLESATITAKVNDL